MNDHPEEIKQSENDLSNSDDSVQIFSSSTVNVGVRTNYDFLFKISLIGDSGSGKTSTLIRLTEHTFRENTSSTIGVDFKILSVKYKSKQAKVQIWDTCGSERFKSLTTSFIKTCSVFVLLFDLSNKKSFENIEYWLNIILENTSPKLVCLVGNKSDLVDASNPEIRRNAIDQFAKKHELPYIETSAKDNTNVEYVFKYISSKLFDEALKSSLSNKNTDMFNTGYKSILTDPNGTATESEANHELKLNIIKKNKSGCCT